MTVCTICGRPEAVLEDQDTHQASARPYPAYSTDPSHCWKKALLNMDPAVIDCLTVALDVERTALALLRAVMVTTTLRNGFGYAEQERHVDGLIRTAKATRLEALDRGIR